MKTTTTTTAGGAFNCAGCGILTRRGEIPFREEGREYCWQCFGGRGVPLAVGATPSARNVCALRYMQNPPRYRDPYRWPRLAALIVALALTFTIGFWSVFAWAVWVCLGVAGMINRANWKGRQFDGPYQMQ